jgi:uncharacterized membrane protein
METTNSPTDRFRDPQADPTYDRQRLRLAAAMMIMGVLHFVVPGPFRKIVPRWFPWRSEAVAISGVAELTSGVLMAFPRTKRVGGSIAVVTLAAVFPANVQMAVDASRGRPQVKAPAWLMWLRVPLQVPMIASAARVARSA